jgi:hypothetical protein
MIADVRKRMRPRLTLFVYAGVTLPVGARARRGTWRFVSGLAYWQRARRDQGTDIETFADLRIGPERLRKNFDRHDAIKPRVAGTI